MSRIVDLTGREFGRLIVVKLSRKQKVKNGSRLYWLCKCQCGNEKEIRGDHIKSLKTQSCGCLERENRERLAFVKSHGQTKTRLYYVWNTMRTRCRNPNAKNHHRYGGRGIKVCDEWNESFEPFYEWAVENGYKQGLTIERIDNDGNYEPSNCKWATYKEQAQNKRNTIKQKTKPEKDDL